MNSLRDTTPAPQFTPESRRLRCHPRYPRLYIGGGGSWGLPHGRRRARGPGGHSILTEVPAVDRTRSVQKNVGSFDPIFSR